MGKTWQVREAKARFSEFLEASAREGPQIVTRRGVEAAVLLPIEQWRRLRKLAQPDLKGLLLAPEARTETLTPPSGAAQAWRAPDAQGTVFLTASKSSPAARSCQRKSNTSPIR